MFIEAFSGRPVLLPIMQEAPGAYEIEDGEIVPCDQQAIDHLASVGFEPEKGFLYRL